MELIEAKQLVTRVTWGNKWFGYDYNMNIYKGCSHGCIYCDSRSDCYRVLDFDRVRGKKNALGLLEKELRVKGHKGVIATGAMSDPYNPMEEEYELTRGALEIIHRYGFGASVTTKKDLLLRDMDLFKKIQTHHPMIIKMTVTTLDDELGKIVEPRATVTSKRLEALKQLSEEGLFTGILLMPLLPFINDTLENVEGIVEAGRQAGVSFIYPGFGVTLRGNQRDYYYRQLDRHFPGLAERYRRRYGERYNCSSPRGRALWSVFKRKCEDYGILYRMEDIIEAYRKPYFRGEQLSLF